MQAVVKRALLFGLIFLFSATGYGFIHESVRIRSLGTDFTGLIEDPYTDVFRNPAYLARWEKGALTAEVLDAEKSIFGTNLAFPSKWLNLGISYQVHGHPAGFKPEDGRDFSGQRVASDLDGPRFPAAKKFQVVRAILAKTVNRLALGADIQYLRDWEFGYIEGYIGNPSFNQLPTAFQIRGGTVFNFKPGTTADFTFHYQRNSPRLQAHYGFSGAYDIFERDSTRIIYFPNLEIIDANSSGNFDELGGTALVRFRVAKQITAALIFSANRVKGSLPVLVGASSTGRAFYGSSLNYNRYSSSLIDTSIQHYQWKYKAGFALTRELPKQTSLYAGAVITVTRTREFYRLTIDSSVAFYRNDTLLQSRQQRLVYSGEQNKSYFTELSIPFGIEIRPKNYFSLRLGLKPFLIIDNPDIDGHYADLNTFYILGAGVKVEDHLQIDSFVQEDLGNLRNWQIALRYVF